jgi:2-octaprenyl-6-methoxyphenol hydroxylase
MLISADGLPDYTDITIVGGGPIGALMALRLEQSGHRVLLLEAQANLIDNPRTLALSWGTIEALQQLGIWQANFPATPIHQVHISQADSIGRTLLKATDFNLPALGYVVRYDDLLRAIQPHLQQAQLQYAMGVQVNHIHPLSSYTRLTLQAQHKTHTLTTRLVIMADGGGFTEALPVTQYTKNYRQMATVSTVSIATPHHFIAYERFTPQGPLALLPHHQDFALVWTQTPEETAFHLTLPDEAFLAALQKRFKGRAPEFTALKTRYTFPLAMKSLKKPFLPHLVFIGNAAQTLHPVAGQGLNLGIRDVLTLSRVIHTTLQHQLGTPQMLTRYYKARRTDTYLMLSFTDVLADYFYRDWPLLKSLRSVSLTLLEQQPHLKKQLGKSMLFGF